MPPTNRNYPDAMPPWEDKRTSPFQGPDSTDGGSLETPPTAGKQPIAEDRGTNGD
jgi:hypothetical protein